jgi:putative membrane protein
MKFFKAILFCSGAFIWGLPGCSSTNTETISTAPGPRDAAPRAVAVIDSGATSSEVPADTTSFPVVAASNDLFEILSGNLAQNKAKHPDVKTFAGQMITEHTKTSNQLKSLVRNKNLSFPTSPIPLHQRMLARLERENANDFDETYMEMQISAHEQAIALFESAAKTDTDPDLRAFAAKTLPALRTHLDLAHKTKPR